MSWVRFDRMHVILQGKGGEIKLAPAESRKEVQLTIGEHMMTFDSQEFVEALAEVVHAMDRPAGEAS